MKHLKFFILLIFFTVPLYSYEFIGHYLEGHNAIGWSVVDETESKGYYVVLTGECLLTGEYGCNSYDYGILRVDKRGNEMDYRVIYHTEYNDKWRGIEKRKRINIERIMNSEVKDRSEDGGGGISRLSNGWYGVVVNRLVCGSDNGDYAMPHVMVLDSGFNVIWERDISDVVDVLLTEKIKESGDGNLIIYCVNAPTMKVSINDGREIWRINSSNDIEEVGGGYIRCRGNQISMIDKNGDSIWTKAYTSDVDSNHLPLLQAIEKGIGGGYISAGRYYYHTDSYHFVGFVVRVDDTGGVIWKREYPGWLRVEGIFNVGDGYVVGGNYREPTFTLPIYTFILKIDTCGNVEWERDYIDSSTILWMNDIRRSVDGGYIMTGEYTTQHIYLIKTDSMGLVDDIGENIFIPSITGPDYVIRSERELTELFKGNPGIKIYDLSGREITLKPIYFNLRRGIYLYEDKRSKKRGLIMLIIK